MSIADGTNDWIFLSYMMQLEFKYETVNIYVNLVVNWSVRWGWMSDNGGG